MEIAALADTTAELPLPWRKQAIHVVHAIMDRFKRAWRNLRQHRPQLRLPSKRVSPADDAGPVSQT